MTLMMVTSINMDAESHSSFENVKLFLNCCLVTSDCLYELDDTFDDCVNDLVCGMLEIQFFIMGLCCYVFVRDTKMWNCLYVMKRRNFNFAISSAFLVVTDRYQMSISSLMD